MTIGAPPLMATRFSSPSSQNPTDCPSGEKNGFGPRGLGPGEEPGLQLVHRAQVKSLGGVINELPPVAGERHDRPAGVPEHLVVREDVGKPTHRARLAGRPQAHGGEASDEEGHDGDGYCHGHGLTPRSRCGGDGLDHMRGRRLERALERQPHVTNRLNSLREIFV